MVLLTPTQLDLCSHVSHFLFFAQERVATLLFLPDTDAQPLVRDAVLQAALQMLYRPLAAAVPKHAALRGPSSSWQRTGVPLLQHGNAWMAFGQNISTAGAEAHVQEPIYEYPSSSRSRYLLNGCVMYLVRHVLSKIIQPATG